MKMITWGVAALSAFVVLVTSAPVALATPADGCYGNNYFNRDHWRCEQINPAPPPPGPVGPPPPWAWCYWCPSAAH